MEILSARWLGILRLAAHQLRHRWLESLFILLGIALGVGVFTGMETYLNFSERLSEETARLNPRASAAQVQARTFDLSAFYQSPAPAVRLPPTLDLPVQFPHDDLLELRERVPVVGKLFVSGSARGSTIRAVDGESLISPSASAMQIMVRPITPDEPEYRSWRLLAGTFFTWDDVLDGRPVLVLDEGSAAAIFPNLPFDEVIGRTITAGFSSGPTGSTGLIWTIIGVVENQNDPLLYGVHGYGPLGIFGNATYREFLILPSEGVPIEEMIRQVQAHFDQLYGPGKVEVREPLIASTSNREFTLSLLVLSGLALLIAAVNILNLFTARVLRRQRFTGMSVALGATRSMLFWQTSGEALLLGIVGSGLGLLIAHGLVRLLVLFLTGDVAVLQEENLFDGIGITAIDAWIGMGIGTGISLLFGLYPGLLSARQDPSDALRIE